MTISASAEAARENARTPGGEFGTQVHTAPDVELAAGDAPRVNRAPDVQAAIDDVTFGPEQLQHRFDVGRYEYMDLVSDARRMWENAGGPKFGMLELENHLGVSDPENITPADVERVLEVAHYRASTGRYVERHGRYYLETVANRELTPADRDAERQNEAASSAMSQGHLADDVEISGTSAKAFAEYTLQQLPEKEKVSDYPRLAELAWRPYSEDAGAVPAKVDELLKEISRVRGLSPWLAPAQELRLDMLATYALHGHTS